MNTKLLLSLGMILVGNVHGMDDAKKPGLFPKLPHLQAGIGVVVHTQQQTQPVHQIKISNNLDDIDESALPQSEQQDIHTASSSTQTSLGTSEQNEASDQYAQQDTSESMNASSPEFREHNQTTSHTTLYDYIDHTTAWIDKLISTPLKDVWGIRTLYTRYPIVTRLCVLSIIVTAVARSKYVKGAVNKVKDAINRLYEDDEEDVLYESPKKKEMKIKNNN